MKTSAPCLLGQVLSQPAIVEKFRDADWDLLVRQGRWANLLGQLSALFEAHSLLGQVPSAPRDHLLAARAVATRHAASVHWEVNLILKALQPLDVAVILLKGAAYTMLDLPAGKGRLFYDIDILVPGDRLAAVERALRRCGWESMHLNPYDQRYFRQWMHELPPLEHVRRKTVLDVHHTILPITAALRPDPEKLRAAARPLANHPKLHVLSAPDMVLHSAAHLFYSDGEFTHGLRDLLDLAILLRYFSAQEEALWNDLIARAKELDLTRPLHYALRYTAKLLNTPVPLPVQERAAIIGRPPIGMADWMDRLFTRVLRPEHSSCRDYATGLARGLLYIRAHALRMPLRLLIPHLTRKAIRRELFPRARLPGAL
jgi:hypothetical protein